jgi:hypothetical protein
LPGEHVSRQPEIGEEPGRLLGRIALDRPQDVELCWLVVKSPEEELLPGREFDIRAAVRAEAVPPVVLGQNCAVFAEFVVREIELCNNLKRASDIGE